MSRPELYVSLVVGPNCDMESYAVRSVLEYFGARGHIRPNDLINVLSGSELENKKKPRIHNRLPISCAIHNITIKIDAE